MRAGAYLSQAMKCLADAAIGGQMGTYLGHTSHRPDYHSKSKDTVKRNRDKFTREEHVREISQDQT